MKNKSNKLPKWLIVCLVIVIVLGVYALVGTITFSRKIHLPIQEYTAEEHSIALDILEEDYNPIGEQRTDSEYKQLVEKQVGISFYFYTEKDLGNRLDGTTHPLLRIITIDSTISGYDYCIALAHEALHLKTFCANERYICIETFKFLYENEDEELHNIGVWYARDQLFGLYRGDYNIQDFIINYLLKGENK
jgi:hypothetical protein